MSRDPGTYVLVLVIEQDMQIEVGALGTLFFRAGHYLYVGSALGGLGARLARHLRQPGAVVRYGQVVSWDGEHIDHTDLRVLPDEPADMHGGDGS